MPRAQRGGTKNRTAYPLLQDRLILNRFFCHLLGFNDFKGLRELLRNVRQGDAEDGHSHFYHTLRAQRNLRIPADELAAYDLRIKDYTARLNRQRMPKIQLLYFQYLAILFTEIFLERWFAGRAAFATELNAFVQGANTALSYTTFRYPTFSENDLNKIAFWMATGSGKTLIMHVNLWQMLRYRHHPQARFDGILLITPNEGLSRQHLDELRASGIAARHYGEASGMQGALNGDAIVTVIEITKLTESKHGGGLSVEVDAFGPNNLLFVDEGHRGASGEVWRALRDKVAERGFTFEYSATFGQIVNGASLDRRADLLTEYAKAILFDYSYPHFYHDGYGKDYWIVNIADETDTFNEWMILANLVAFFEQQLAFEEQRECWRAYNLEKPLWVFVGHSVTGGKSRENETSLTDVEEIIAFYARFLRQPKTYIARLEKLLAGETGLRDGERDLFAERFAYLKQKQWDAATLYAQIVARVFHANVGDTLRAVELKAAPGEIGLRVGAENPYFGVINIGDVARLMQLLGQGGITCEEENISRSLFDCIKDADSTVNVLIGSRKFMEGWDCYRVASMGLMNIGKGEGAQIIQLFGRGVRLHGKDNSLKRSKMYDTTSAPQHIELLETLNIFGIRANYMAQFRDYLKQEGIEVDWEEVVIPIQRRDDFIARGLRVLRPPSDARFEGTVLCVDATLEINLDVRPRVEVARAVTDTEVRRRAEGEDRIDTLRQLAPLFDWERMYFDLVNWTRTQKWYTLVFTRDTLRTIFREGRFHLYCPADALPPRGWTNLSRAQDLALGLLRKYIGAFYARERQRWERDHIRLAPLTSDDPNVAFGAYQVRARAMLAATIRQLVKQADELYKQDVVYFPNIHFDRHLYQPLLLQHPHIESVSPPALNEGEKRFVSDLRSWLQGNAVRWRDYEFFLLRNLTRGKGIGFFESSADATFYPDFILWVIRNKEQWIAFIDPHGMRYTDWNWRDDPRVKLHRDLVVLERELQKEETEWRVHLTSFIISTTSQDELVRISGASGQDWEQEHILFLDKHGKYIERCVEMLLGQPLQA